MPKRLLIVDDEPEVVDLMAEYFELRGYAVDKALSGRDALALAAERRPDLVLLDIRMPGMTGTEVLNRLLAVDPRMPVVIVTADEDVELARELIVMGAVEHVAKPFDLPELERVVTTALRRGT